MEYFKSPDITLEGEMDEQQSRFIIAVLEVAEKERLSIDELLRTIDILNGNIVVAEADLSEREMHIIRKCMQAFTEKGIMQ